MKKTKSLLCSVFLSLSLLLPSYSTNGLTNTNSTNANNNVTTVTTTRSMTESKEVIKTSTKTNTQALSKAMTQNAKAASTTEDVMIVAINDFHGSVLKEGKNPGIAVVAGAINELKKEYKNLTFVSSGDSYQGSAMSNLTKGAVVNDAFKAMGIRASAIGNHEYDWGYDMMNTWSNNGNFPFLASNIVYKSNGMPVNYAKPYNVVSYTLSSGKVVKVGYIGIATPETATKTLVENVKDVNFTNPTDAANKWATYLRNTEKVDAVVALTHLGGFQDKDTKVISGEVVDFANNVKGVDLIFSAHTHQSINGKINNVQILQGYYNGRNLSEAKLTFDTTTGALTNVTGVFDNISARKDTIVPDPQVAAIVSSYEGSLAPILNEVLGNNPQELTHDTNTQIVTPLGEWTAKKLSELGNTQIGYVNGGGIRNPLDAGDITMGEMYSIFPFDNTLVTMDITGADLKNIVQHGIIADNMRPGQFYGINVYYDKDTKQITSMTLLDGTKVEDGSTYTLSTIDFLYTGGDKYDFKNASNVVDTHKPIRDLLAEDIKANNGINFEYTQNLFDKLEEVPPVITTPISTTVPVATSTPAITTTPSTTASNVSSDTQSNTKEAVVDNSGSNNESNNVGKYKKLNKDLPNTGSVNNALPLVGGSLLLISYFIYIVKSHKKDAINE